MVETLPPCRIVVLISGNGTNLEVIIKACSNKLILGNVVGVISNQPEALGLTKARKAGIPAYVLDHRTFDTRESFDTQLQKLIDSMAPHIVALAGFMRILGPKVVQHFLGRLVNIHPSLLPKYPGLNTHARVLKNGEKTHGVTVHFVTPQLDAGPIILQKKILVRIQDTEQTLAKKIQKEEHDIYPRAINWFALGRLQLIQNVAYLDGQKIGL